MNPTEKLRWRAEETWNAALDLPDGQDWKLLEAALIETRNEAFEECAQELVEIGADNLVGVIHLLKARK